MQTDILDFTIKLLSKCIPVKVRKLKKSTLESLRTEGYSDFSSIGKDETYDKLSSYKMFKNLP